MPSLHRFILTLLTCIGMLAFSAQCFAKSTDELEVDWLGDSVLLGTTGAMWFTFELLKDEIAPKKCIWCASNTMDDSITDAISWNNPRYAALTSDIVVMCAIPALSVSALLLSGGMDGRIHNAGVDLMIMGEAFALSSLANQFVKFSVGRERPFAARKHHELYEDRMDDNLSFYSGHTNMAFALVVSSGMIAHYRNYEVEPYIWAIGIPIALSVGLLRISAEKHYFTDVMIGAVIGTAIGLLVPWMHHQGSKGDSESPVMTDKQPLMLSISGRL